jgi:hypothetical protein
MNCTLLKFSIMLKNLRNLNDVQNHELIHSGVNPYKFSNCAKGLINPDKVKWHEIIHGHWLLHLWQLKNYSWRMDQNLIVYSPPASEAKRVLAQPSVYCHMVLMVYSPVLAVVIVFLMKNPIVAVCGTILSATLFVSGSTPIQTYPCTKTYKKIFKEKQFHLLDTYCFPRCTHNRPNHGPAWILSSCGTCMDSQTDRHRKTQNGCSFTLQNTLCVYNFAFSGLLKNNLNFPAAGNSWNLRAHLVTYPKSS